MQSRISMFVKKSSINVPVISNSDSLSYVGIRKAKSSLQSSINSSAGTGQRCSLSHAGTYGFGRSGIGSEVGLIAGRPLVVKGTTNRCLHIGHLPFLSAPSSGARILCPQ